MRTIIMADDDMEDLELFADAIHEIEPEVELLKMTNGKSVIDYLSVRQASELPCLIILDYNMPELSGPEVLEKICRDERYERIPKLILSTSNSPAYISECMEQGATRYFVKPNNLKDLHAIVATMLNYCAA